MVFRKRAALWGLLIFTLSFPVPACSSAGHFYAAESSVAPSEVPGSYDVDVKISRLEGKGASVLLSHPQLIVSEGKEGSIQVVASEEEGLYVWALVQKKSGLTEATVTVRVLMEDHPVWQSRQTLKVR